MAQCDSNRILRKSRHFPLFCVMLGLLHLFSNNASSQIKIVLITKDKVSVNTAREVTCVRGAARPPVVRKMSLEVGDRLLSESTSVKLQINCRGANYYLTAPFSIRFLKPTGPGCFTGYRSSGGKIYVVSKNTPTNNKTAHGHIITRTTLFGYGETTKERQGLARMLGFFFPCATKLEVSDYEGIVQVKTASSSETLGTGQKMIVVGDRAPIIQKITQAELKEFAEVLAEFDASQLPISDPQKRREAFLKIVPLREAQLANPEDKQNEVNLKRELEKLGIPEEDQTSPSSNLVQTPESNNAALQSHSWVEGSYKVTNRCQKPHTYRFTPQNLSFPYRPLTVESTALPGAVSQARFEFDTTGLKPGEYRGEMLIECLDCNSEEGCVLIEPRVPVTVRKGP